MKSFSAVASIVLGALLLSACSFSNLLSPYRVDIRQGNYVTQEMVAQLKPGMTKDQVRFALGTPLVSDMFHGERWDYLYRFKPGVGEVQQRHLAVYFDQGKLAEARMRVLGLSVADCERPEAGSVLGRLYLDPRNKLTKAQYEAGIRMGEDFARYYALTGIPFPTASAIDLTRVHGIGRDPNSAAVRAASSAIMAIEATLGMADESGRPVTSVCKAVCIRDEPIYHGHMIEFLKCGLHALVEHYGCQRIKRKYISTAYKPHGWH